MPLVALTAFAAASLPSCELIDTIGTRSGPDSSPDSLVTVVCLKDMADIGATDIFVYGNGGLGRLEGRSHLCSPTDSASFLLESGDKIVVGIANCRDSLDSRALDAYDTMELLRFYYQDDRSVCGLMSGTAYCSAGDTVSLAFSSPMCRITLESIEHSFDGYRRLEDPVVYLSVVNPSVEALRRDSILPSETLSDTSGLRGMMWDRLPCDIGMYPQYPGTELFCYPNESGVTPTRLTVEGTPSGGERCKFTTPLPPLSYGDRLSISLRISVKPEDYRFSIEKR